MSVEPLTQPTQPKPIQPKPTLRDYRPGSDPDDWRAMHALDEQCFAPPFRFTARAMRRFAERPGAITLLAESDGLLVAFAIAHLEPQPPTRLTARQPAQPPEAAQPEAHTAYIVTLDVAPAWRRKGLARRLMHQLEARAHAACAASMALHVFPGNQAAVQLYEALGYQRAAVAASFYAPGLDALVYRKPLERKPITPAPQAAPQSSAP